MNILEGLLIVTVRERAQVDNHHKKKESFTSIVERAICYFR